MSPRPPTTTQAARGKGNNNNILLTLLAATALLAVSSEAALPSSQLLHEGSSSSPQSPSLLSLSSTTTTAEKIAIAPRIVGGGLADAREYPWYVSPTGRFFCGGSLIAPDMLLTAAHCDLAFVVGEDVHVGAFVRGTSTEGAVRRTIARAIPHPNYQEATVLNDFMVVQLSDAVSTIAPIVLNADPAVPAAQEDVTVMGFGLLENGGSVTSLLNEVDLQALRHDNCRSAYLGIANIDEDVMLCAGDPLGGRGSCQGDSGGPLVTADGTQVGIVSFGVADGCGEADYPGVYARVSGAYDWIQQAICTLSESPPASCGGATPPDGGAPIPTPAPTEAGPPPAVDEGSLTVKFVITYDGKPDETTWIVRQDGRTLYEGPQDYTPGPNERWETAFSEFPEGSFTFSIRDVAGDGMASGTAGFFEIIQVAADGREVLLARGGGRFFYSQSVDFTVSTDPQGPSPDDPRALPACSCSLAASACIESICNSFAQDVGLCLATTGCAYLGSLEPPDSGDEEESTFLEDHLLMISGAAVALVVVILALLVGLLLCRRCTAAKTSSGGRGRNSNNKRKPTDDTAPPALTATFSSQEPSPPSHRGGRFVGHPAVVSYGSGVDKDGLAYEDV
jgi:hypothetical protein